ncbi:4Fe-4S binding protein [Eubacteriaceae bacterium ES3]|nr:4Fe-4S binding protein [Eubacteriaceae bacterium ES3]
MAETISNEDVKRVKGLGFLRNKRTDNFSGRVITINGVVNADQMACILEGAQKYGNGTLALTTRLTIECPGIPYAKIEDFRAHLKTGGLETGGTGPKVRPVTACKGTTCQYGLIDTFGLAAEIHKRFYKGYRDLVLPHKFKIAVGGCPNNCMKPDLNDAGVVGQLIPELEQSACKNCKSCGVIKACPVNAAKLNDGRIEIDRDSCLNCGLCVGKCPFDAVTAGLNGYKLVIGGRWGKQVAMGKALTQIFADEESLLAMLEKIILFYSDQGEKGERFSQTIKRLGFDAVEKMLTDN